MVEFTKTCIALPWVRYSKRHFFFFFLFEREKQFFSELINDFGKKYYLIKNTTSFLGFTRILRIATKNSNVITTIVCISQIIN